MANLIMDMTNEEIIAEINKLGRKAMTPNQVFRYRSLTEAIYNSIIFGKVNTQENPMATTHQFPSTIRNCEACGDPTIRLRFCYRCDEEQQVLISALRQAGKSYPTEAEMRRPEWLNEALSVWKNWRTWSIAAIVGLFLLGGMLALFY